MLSHQDRTSSATAQSDQVCFVNSLASHILLTADHHSQQIPVLIDIFPISTIKWEIMSTYALWQPLHSSWNLFTYSPKLISGTLSILTSECNLLCNCITNSSAGILMPDRQMLQIAGSKTSQISNTTLFWHSLFWWMWLWNEGMGQVFFYSFLLQLLKTPLVSTALHDNVLMILFFSIFSRFTVQQISPLLFQTALAIPLLPVCIKHMRFY